MRVRVGPVSLQTPPDEPKIMRFIFKTLFRTAAIGAALTAAVVGGASMIVGPDRVEAMAGQLQTSIEQRFDASLDDPAALARQIAQAKEQYPARIREIRSDLMSLRDERARLEREQKVSERVVVLVDHDLSKLLPEVEKARLARADGAPRAQLVAVTFDDEVMSFRRANAKVKEIERTRMANVARAADAQHNLKYLRNQEERFETILDKLEEENAQFGAQLAQLNNEVKSIARNERLIKMLESRQSTLDEVETFEASSLDQITTLLERKRAAQELELDQLASTVESVNYEELAKSELLGQ